MTKYELSNDFRSYGGQSPLPEKIDKKNFPSSIKLEFKPTFIKQLGGVWLLIANPAQDAYIYNVLTLRHTKTLETGSRVTSAASSKYLLFVGTANRQIIVYDMKDWTVDRRLNTLQASTAMDILGDRILVYGLGDDGYGCVFFKEDFRQYERSTTPKQNEGKKPLAKTNLMANFRKDGFVFKTGGYTTAAEKKKTLCWVTCLGES